MCAAPFWFLIGPHSEAELEDGVINRLMQAVVAFVVGGAMTLAACFCVYVERFKATQK